MKRLIPCIFLYQEKAVKNFKDMTVLSENPVRLAKTYCENAADELLVFDMSKNDAEHEKALTIMKEICSAIEIPVIGAGNIKRMEDVKKILYTGCAQAVLNYDKEENIEITEEVSQRFGKDKICLSFTKPETLSVHRQLIDACISDTIWIEQAGKVRETVACLNDPTIIVMESCSLDGISRLFENPAVVGISGNAVNDNYKDLYAMKSVFQESGVEVKLPKEKLSWSDFKLNTDGHVPVVVQDYRTDEVLMVAYMNEEAFLHTLKSGKMTYYSRSRQELWIKGETSGHYQYVKSLTADCDYDTILAKVSQVGPACHTGSHSCFFNEIMSRDFKDASNPLKVFEEVMRVIEDRKLHPREGSYTNYLFDKGLDKILKKVGEEASEIIIAAKNPDPNEVKYEISDFLYHMMVLMAEKGVSWEDITTELANRE